MSFSLQAFTDHHSAELPGIFLKVEKYNHCIEVLRIRFLLDPAPEPELQPNVLELELHGSGSLLESAPPLYSAPVLELNPPQE